MQEEWHMEATATSSAESPWNEAASSSSVHTTAKEPASAQYICFSYCQFHSSSPGHNLQPTSHPLVDTVLCPLYEFHRGLFSSYLFFQASFDWELQVGQLPFCISKHAENKNDKITVQQWHSIQMEMSAFTTNKPSFMDNLQKKQYTKRRTLHLSNICSCKKTKKLSCPNKWQEVVGWLLNRNPVNI